MAKTWVRDPSSAPLRVCPCTPRPRDMVLVARDVRGHWPGHVQRDTTSDGTLALGHSRSGFTKARVSRWGRGFESRTRCQNKEPSSSSRFEGGNRPQRLGGAGTRDRMDFIGGVAQLLESSLLARGRLQVRRGARQIAEIAQQVERRVEGACVGGSKPSLGTRRQNLVSSAGSRAPVYEAGGRTFESCTRCHQWVRGREADCGCL